MTEEKQDIRSDFYAGNTKDIQFTIVDGGNAPFNLASCEINYALFDDDYNIMFRKSSSNGSGEIEITHEDGGVCLVHCISTDTEHLQGQYRHQLQLVDSNGYTEIVSTGTVLIHPAMAKRSRKLSRHSFLEGTLT